jgi:ATP-dependent Lon protease
MAVRQRIPLFPLGVVLLPGETLPLHIFEERYKRMVRYCIANEIDFGIVHSDEDGLKDIGCTAGIRNIVKEYEDNTLDIETRGDLRFRIISLHDDEIFTEAEVEMLQRENDVSSVPDRERLVAQHMKLMEILGEKIRPHVYESAHQLSFRVGATAGLDIAQRQELLEIDTEGDRIAFLVKHLEEFIPRVQSVKERQDRVRSNGHFH